MTNLIKALAAGLDGEVLTSSKNFDAALVRLNDNCSSTDTVASLKYEERLQTRLEEMPSETLNALGKAATVFLDTTADFVVALLDGAIQVELARREDVLSLSADRHMANVWDALASGEASKVPASVQAFEDDSIKASEALSSSSRTPAPLSTQAGMIRRTLTNLSAWLMPTDKGRTTRDPVVTVSAVDGSDIQKPLESADAPLRI